MKSVLFDPRGKTLHDVVPAGQEFLVAPPFQWLSVDDSYDPRTWRYVDGAPRYVAPVPPAVSDEERRSAAVIELLEKLLEEEAARPNGLASAKAYIATRGGPP